MARASKDWLDRHERHDALSLDGRTQRPRRRVPVKRVWATVVPLVGAAWWIVANIASHVAHVPVWQELLLVVVLVLLVELPSAVRWTIRAWRRKRAEAYL